MQRGKFLYTQKIKDHKSGGNDVDLSVYGVFETVKVEWKYYVISYYNKPNSSFMLTMDVCGCSYNQEATYDSITKYGKKFETKEEGIKFIQDYKIKWETGSNNTIQEVRDQKIDDILEDN
jgi:predicted DNA-binding protein YlxM (UPF0122 family)